MVALSTPFFIKFHFMLHRILLIAILAFWGCAGIAQSSIYEFEYYFDINNTRENYNAFMVRNGDGTGFMRVRYIDEATKAPIVIDLLMQEHYMGDENADDEKSTDSSILVFEGFDPQVVIGPKDEKYDPDIFLFYKNDATGYYEPAVVVSTDDDSKDVEGVFNMHLLNEANLTKELVSKYFTPEDGFFDNFFESATVRIPTSQKNTRLFLLLIANTDDISIGPTCVVDKDATYKTFSQLAEFMQIQFVPKIIFGKDFTKVNVDNAINSINPGTADIVVFYYSGHGFAYSTDNHLFPFLDLRDKAFQNFGGSFTLSMEDIYKRIKSKSARLNLVLSDCCNADPSQNSTISSDVATTRTSSIGWNMENCMRLFMDTKPISILMTAASKGELSAGNSTGGIFTFNFRESLEKSIGHFASNVSWQQLLTAAQQQTVTKAQRTWCDKDKKIVCKQKPTYTLEQR